MADSETVVLKGVEWVEASAVSCTFSAPNKLLYREGAEQPADHSSGHDYVPGRDAPITWGLAAPSKLWMSGHGTVLITHEG